MRDEERLSKYIDELNQEAPHHRTVTGVGAEALRAAARAVKSVRPETPASPSFQERLVKAMGAAAPANHGALPGKASWPAAVRPQGLRGLGRIAAGVVAAALVVTLVLVSLNTGSRSALAFFTKAAEVSADPAAAGITGFRGIMHNDAQYENGEYVAHESECLYVAPDKFFTRNLATGRVSGSNGKVKWWYDPVRQVAETIESPFPGSLPFTSAIPGGGGLWDVISVVRRTGTWRGEVSFAGDDVVAGRQTRVVEVAATVNPERTSRLRFWIDTETYLVLRMAQVLPDESGTIVETVEGGDCGFTQFELTPPSDLSVFEPAIPEGVPVIRTTWAEPAPLAAQIGLFLPERLPVLPTDWEMAAGLTRYPHEALERELGAEFPPAPDSAGYWSLLLWCRPSAANSNAGRRPQGDLGAAVSPGQEGDLSLVITNVPSRLPWPPEFSGTTTVEVLGGVTGAYQVASNQGQPVGRSTLSWALGDIRYNITDDYGLFTLDQLLEMAGALAPGR